MSEADWDRVAPTFEEDVLIVSEHDRQGKLTHAIQGSARPDGVAADLGCGIGSNIGLLAEHFAEVYAVDLSTRCLQRARHAHARFSNVHYVHADLAASLPIPAADLVLSVNVLLTADPVHRGAMWDRTCAAANPGAHLVMVVPSLESALYATQRLVGLNEKRGMNPRAARSKASRNMPRLDVGIVVQGGTPTKHYLKEELIDELHHRNMAVLKLEKIEYPWSYKLAEAPARMRPPMPWNWLVVARRAAPQDPQRPASNFR